MATKCQTSVQVHVHLYCPTSFACWGKRGRRGFILLVPLLYYSYLSLQSHKTHPQLIARLQNRQPNSLHLTAAALSGQCGMDQRKASVCRPVIWVADGLQARDGANVKTQRQSQSGMSFSHLENVPQCGFLVPAGAKFVIASYLYFILWIISQWHASLCPFFLLLCLPNLLSLFDPPLHALFSLLSHFLFHSSLHTLLPYLFWLGFRRAQVHVSREIRQGSSV